MFARPPCEGFLRSPASGWSSKWNNASVDFGKLAGDLAATTRDGLEAMARMHLILANPIITRHLPGISLEADITPLSQDYTGGTMKGEGGLVFRLRSGGPKKGTGRSRDWSTTFPNRDFLVGIRARLCFIG